MSDFTVVLPTYNEAENIVGMIRSLRSGGEGPAIIVVDDNSPDGTFELASTECASVPNLRVLRHTGGTRGLSQSVVFGFEHAETPWLCCMDADGQHRAEDLRAMTAYAEKSDAVMIVGSRHVPGGGFTEKWNVFRSLFSRTATLAARIVLGVRIHDPMSGFFLIRRETFESVKKNLSPRGFKIALELLNLATVDPEAKVAEFPITFAMRRHGESKFSSKVVFEYLAMLVRCGKLKRVLRREFMKGTDSKCH